MKQKISVITLLLLVFSLQELAFSQINSEKFDTRILPPNSQNVDCELALRYIDDAINKAHSNKSNLIFIVKMKNLKNRKLIKSRLKNIKLYMQFRGFKDFETAVGLNSDEKHQLDLYISGELLYTLPIDKNYKLDFRVCVVGPDL